MDAQNTKNKKEILMENSNTKVEKKSLMKWIPVFVLSLGLAIIIIDSTLLNVSFGYLIRDLNTDLTSLQWVITAYSLVLAALTITGGRLGDLFGRKRMFAFGAFIFAIGSLVASNSHQVSTMIIGEAIIEGIGAAMMMPATASLLVSTYQGRDRAIAMGMWGGVAGAASAIGPILGGYLTTHYSWRWGFRINIVVAAILILGSLILKERRDEEEKPTIDWLGVLLSSTGLLSFVFGIIESSTYGWIRAKQDFITFGHTIALHGYSIVLPSMILGVILLTFFVLWESKVTKDGNTPLVSLSLFKNSQFNSGIAVTSIMSLAQSGLIFSLPIFFQAVRGLDAYHTGLAILPMSITALVLAPLSAFLSHKISPKRMIQAGLICTTAAMFVIEKTLNIDATAHDFALGMVLYGAGIGLSMASLSNITLSAVSVEEAGEASGVNNTLRQIGATLGSAIIGAALLTALTNNLKDGINNSVVIPAQAKTAIAQQVDSQTSNVEFGGGAKLDSKVPPAISNEIVKISHQATTDSNKVALKYAMVFIILGFFASFFLPNKKNVERNQSAAH